MKKVYIWSTKDIEYKNGEPADMLINREYNFRIYTLFPKNEKNVHLQGVFMQRLGVCNLTKLRENFWKAARDCGEKIERENISMEPPPGYRAIGRYNTKQCKLKKSEMVEILSIPIKDRDKYLIQDSNF
ncbi:MAG: hypothetical protein JSV39_01105 [Candidatus Aenigmatarchaeota archaeon]|nr:MAG: hypothetical protein JSV39_01105 [Candidatus Aenigmarchaeota archaeon]